MKKIVFSFLSLFSFFYLSAQDPAIQTRIRELEQQEAQAVLQKDTVTLRQLWDKDYVVNNPENKIVLAKPNPVDRPVLQNQIISFTRVVESVILNSNVASSMGHETVVSIDATTKLEKTVERRYTNIWMKKEGGWKLIARHANKICQW